MDKEKLISRLGQYFSRFENISTVYLFGSIAKNKDRKKSDIDIAVLFKKGMDLFERFEHKLKITSELEDLFERKVDVVDLQNADMFFIHKIMEEKILISNKDVNQRVEFEVQSRKRFFDREHFYKLYHECSMKRLEEMH